MSRLQAAVFQVLEGFTLSDDVRKILESAYHSDDSFTQGRAAGLEERAAFERAAGKEGEHDARFVKNFGSEVYFRPHIAAMWEGWKLACAALSPTSSDAGKDDALLTIARDALEEIALAGMSGSGQESEEGMRDWHARRAWEFIGIAARAKTAIDAALSSLEVIGKGAKG